MLGMPSPLDSPILRDDLPRYPPLLQLIRVTGSTVPGPGGDTAVLYIASTQQLRTDNIAPRDREPCLVVDVNRGGLTSGYYLGRLAGSYSGLPVYEVASILGSAGLGPAGPSGAPGATGPQGPPGTPAVSSLPFTVDDLANSTGGPVELSVVNVNRLQFTDFNDNDTFTLSSPTTGVARVEFVPAASGQAGYVTTVDQSWAGTKSIVGPGINRTTISSTSITIYNNVFNITTLVSSSGMTLTGDISRATYGFSALTYAATSLGVGCEFFLSSTDNNRGAASIGTGYNTGFDTFLTLLAVGAIATGVTFASGGVNLTSGSGTPVYAVNGLKGQTTIVNIARLSTTGAPGSLTFTGGILTNHLQPT